MKCKYYLTKTLYKTLYDVFFYILAVVSFLQMLINKTYFIMFKAFLIVGVGSFFGGGTRYLIQQFVLKISTFPFPFGTLAVNIIGSFIIGIIFGVNLKTNTISSEMKWFLVTGFCGGFTTFSSFSLETFSLFREGQYVYFFSYVATSVVIGLLATFTGVQLIKMI